MIFKAFLLSLIIGVLSVNALFIPFARSPVEASYLDTNRPKLRRGPSWDDVYAFSEREPEPEDELYAFFGREPAVSFNHNLGKAGNMFNAFELLASTMNVISNGAGM